MLRILNVIAFGFVFLFCHPVATGFQPNQQLLQEQQTNLGKLLKKLRLSLDLTDEQVANLNGLLKEDVEAAALEVEEKRKPLRFGMELDGVTRNLEKAMLNKAVQVLPADKTTGLKEFVASQKLLWQLDDKHGQSAVLIFLDRNLCLNEEQWAILEEALAENWEPFWNEHVVNLMGFNAFISCLPILDVFDQELLETVLSEKQMAVLTDISKFVPGLELLGRDAPLYASQWDAEEFRKLCHQLFELKIEEYRGLVKLSSGSEKLLRIGGKAAVGKVVESRKKAMEALAEDFNAINQPIVQASTKMAILPQCLIQSEFVKAAKKALSEKKHAKAVDRELLRTKTEVRYYLYHIWFKRIAPATGMNLSYEELTSLLQIMDDIIESDQENRYQKVAERWLTTPDEKFQSILSEDNWRRFRVNLESNRSRILENRK